MADLALRYFVSLKSAFLLLLHIKNKTPEKSGGSSAVWGGTEVLPLVAAQPRFQGLMTVAIALAT